MRLRLLEGWPAALIACGLWILLGLTGHEPWKPDEAYSFGLVLHILQTGDWVIPTLGGEPFMEKPPALYMTAAVFAKVFGAWLPLHDAARLAIGFYLSLTLLFISLTARETGDRPGQSLAPLLFIAGIGLFELSHRLQTDIPLMAGIVMSIYGLALIRRRPRFGGLMLGCGTGLAFLSKGIIGPGFVGLIAIALTGFSSWRSTTVFKGWAYGLMVSLPWLLLWPLLLYLRSPDAFHEWFWINNISRFISTENTGLGPKSEPWFYTKTLPWFAWPSLPLALWAAWKVFTRQLKSDDGLILGAVSFGVMLAVLAIAHDARGNYALPLLPPLALIASRGLQQLGPTGQTCWSKGGVLLFGLLLLVLWLGWLGMHAGAPAFWLARLERMQAGYADAFRPLAVGVAALISLGWLWSLRHQRHSVAWCWGAGMAVVWGVYSLLWVPFVDYGRSYKTVMTGIGQHLDRTQCVSSIGYGEPQRAMLDYYAGVKAERLEVHPDSKCPQLLVQNAQAPADQGWILVWEGARPNDTREPHRLYRRE